MNPTTDLEPADLIFPDKEESVQVYHRSHHRWLYLSEQQNSEAYIFRQHDTKFGSTISGVPHASFENPLAGENELPRESIDV